VGMDIKGPGAVSVINRNQLTAFATTVPSKGEFDKSEEYFNQAISPLNMQTHQIKVKK